MPLPSAIHDYPDSVMADARDEFLTDTWATSDWLNQHLHQAEGQTTFIDGNWEDFSVATVDQLWTLILTGSDRQCLLARHELRERMADTSKREIAARVPSMIARRFKEAA